MTVFVLTHTALLEIQGRKELDLVTMVRFTKCFKFKRCIHNDTAATVTNSSRNRNFLQRVLWLVTDSGFCVPPEWLRGSEQLTSASADTLLNCRRVLLFFSLNCPHPLASCVWQLGPALTHPLPGSRYTLTKGSE